MSAMDQAQARKYLRAVVWRAIEDAGWTPQQVTVECERALFEVVFRRANGNQCRMAAELGMHRNTLARNMERLGLLIVRTRTRDKRRRELVRAAA